MLHVWNSSAYYALEFQAYTKYFLLMTVWCVYSCTHKYFKVVYKCAIFFAEVLMNQKNQRPAVVQWLVPQYVDTIYVVFMHPVYVKLYRVLFIYSLLR